uniref:UBX domain-containing protein n=1 Tax=Meleagris gallopavo TaxID=9103 RepID=G1NEQ8_MELGA
ISEKVRQSFSGFERHNQHLNGILSFDLNGQFAFKSIVVFFSVCSWRYSAPSVNAIGCTDVQICSSNLILLNSDEIFSVQSFLMYFQRKLLAIYLHHDESVLTNVFCSQMLCAESIVSYLSQNFITWAWDMTKEANRARFLTMCTRHFGSVVAQTIRTQKTDQFPLFLIIMGKRSSNEVLNVIQGNTTVDELMMRLMAAMEIFSAQQQEDIKDEDEREARENVKREQDEAYRISLEADRAKREAQEREMAEQFRLEQIRKEQEEEREAIRLSLEQSLPPEPKEESTESVSKLRIRTPSGEFFERRFLASSKLQVVFDFVASKGYPWEEYKLLGTFPRRDVTQLDPNKSLLEVKLYPQETLFLEAKE